MAAVARVVLLLGGCGAAALDVSCGSYFGAITSNCTFIRMLQGGTIERRDALPANVCDGTGRTAADLGTAGEHSVYRYLFYAPVGGFDVHQVVMDKADPAVSPLNVTLRASFTKAHAPLLALSQPQSGGRLYALTAPTLYAAAAGSGTSLEPIADLSHLGLSNVSALTARASASGDVLYVVDGATLHVLAIEGAEVQRRTLPLAASLGTLRLQPLITSSDLILAITELPHRLLTVNVTSGVVSPLSIDGLPVDLRSATRAVAMSAGGLMLELLDSQGRLTIGIDDNLQTGQLYHESTPVDQEGFIDTFYLVV